MKFETIFIHKKPIIGVVRLLPLAGYPKFPGTDKVIKTALQDIYKLEKAGFDGVLVDNHSHPHVVKATEKMKNCFTKVMKELVKKSLIPLGVQVLLNDPEASLLIAKESGAKFIRTDFFVDKMKTEYGIMEIHPDKLMKYKKKIKANGVALFADVQVKHAVMLEKKSLVQSVRGAISWGADGVIVTGSWTGIAPSISKIKKVKKEASKANIPVLVGSGFSQENAATILKIVDGVLVGTAVRKGSRIDYKKAADLIKKNLIIKKEGKMISSELEGPKLVDLEKVAQVEQMKDFLGNQGVKNPEFLVSGHMNLSWQGDYGGQPVVCQFGPNLSGYTLSSEQIEGYGYFDPMKYKKAQAVCSEASKAGVPCPQIIKAGFHSGFSRAWNICEVAPGQNLEELWEEMPHSGKVALCAQIGAAVAKIHSIHPATYGQEVILPGSWYRTWLEKVFSNLEAMGIYKKEELEIMKGEVVPQFLAGYLLPFLTTVHGDILQKNFFVEKKKGNYHISGIIDWETAGLGNPWADIILGAWWISGEYGGDKSLYTATLDGYSNALTDTSLSLSLKQAQEMNPYLDLFWYLNILWVRPLMGDYSQVDRRKKMVEKILKELT
jgi:membrane complex biogenesis BtpA family protein